VAGSQVTEIFEVCLPRPSLHHQLSEDNQQGFKTPKLVVLEQTRIINFLSRIRSTKGSLKIRAVIGNNTSAYARTPPVLAGALGCSKLPSPFCPAGKAEPLFLVFGV